MKAQPLTSEERADALEESLMKKLAQPAKAPGARRGVGLLFGGLTPSGVPIEIKPLPAMPAKPTLVDFFKLRFMPHTVTHLLQSATDAQKKGEPEDTVLACLVHDIAINLLKVDHGYWAAQMLEPYVPENVSWAIRHHQALRFFADPQAGYEYPQRYVQIFGEGYQPEPYIRAAYEQARKHKWYMEARMITVHDLYAFDPDTKVSLDPFVDIIGRRFRQPKEGLGFDGSPVAHMWRSLIYPDNPL
jgi:predicted HD phosphohydrolase